jgi:hypothetical protein
MNVKKYVCALGVVAVAAFSAAAQTAPASIAAIETQTPKNGMTQQYEQGRKQKAEWHQQRKDPQPLYVFETMTGDSTGTYLVGRLDQHWADMDKPAIPDASDTEEYSKVIGAYVQSISDRYYEFLPKLSNPDPSTNAPAKFTQLVTFRIHRDKISEFRGALGRIGEAVKKTQWPIHYEFYELVSGGYDGTFVLAEPHASWADFEDKPDVKPLREMLKDAFGQAEADSIYGRLEGAIETEYVEILQFRPDLSYIPAK